VSMACVWAAGVHGADPSGPKKKPLIFEPRNEEQALADQIDKLIGEGWAKHGVTPTEPAGDAEFLRRLSLDVGGRIPWNSEVRAFLEDPSPDKRDRKITQRLNNIRYATYFTSVWRNLLIPPNNNQFGQNFAAQLDPWLRKRLTENRPYDEIVRELLTVPFPAGADFPTDQPFAINPNDIGPRAFYQANESKPETLAANTSRLFLGIRLECAQCHDHPFAKWSREDFWGFAAFFGGLAPQQPQGGFFSPTGEQPDVREIKIPGKDRVVKARFLDRTEPKWRDGVGSRKILAEWITSKENPYFARAVVNRVWADFFGVGIEPVDEPTSDNPPSHPELLDLLAKSFVEHGYDLKFLIGAIVRTRAYQLSSGMTDPSQMDPRLFARMSVKGLTAEQFFDSLALATGYGEREPVNQDFDGMGNATSPKAEFLAKFSNFADKRTEFQTSILQALALMNGKVVADMTSDDINRSKALAAIEDAPFMTTEKKIESLFLSTLSRKPTEKELAKLTKYVDEGGPTKNSRKALGDVFWVLLNSSEFSLNH
jgi:hypothetical protein